VTKKRLNWHCSFTITVAPHMLLRNGLLHKRFGQEIRHVKGLNRWSGSLIIWTGIRIVGFIMTFFTRDTFMLMVVNENGMTISLLSFFEAIRR
jgi:hypothetical protein